MFFTLTYVERCPPPYLCVMERLGAEPDTCVFAGIFAFKCSRAEEIFNMLQEVMHNHSISVVEEAVLEPPQQAAHTPAGTHTHTHL